MAKTFYLFRHGETELNRQKICQGSGMDYDLNDTGKEQAKGLAEKLKGKGLEVNFSSPLQRARHTADTAAELLVSKCLSGQTCESVFTVLPKGSLSAI